MAIFNRDAEKTEQATPRKLEDAVKRGQFPRSAEVQTVFVIFGGLMALTFVGNQTWQMLAGALTATLGHLHQIEVTPPQLRNYLIGGAVWFAQCAGPIVLPIMVAGLLAGGMQSRFNTAADALTPKWERLNPVEGLKRIFSVQSAVPTAVSSVKLGLIVTLTYSVVKDVLTDPIFYTTVSPARIAQFLADSASRIALRIGVVLVFIAIGDYGYQFWKNNRDLMMTKDEVKDEFKHTEGNPLVKSQQRRRRFQITFRKQLAEVPQADVVITNPTHLAIALRYDRKKMRAPKIVAKGARNNALRIRELAAQHQVPVIENKPLARIMYRYGRVDAEVPAQLYAAVAEVLAWVYRTNRYRYYAEQMEATN